MDEQGNLLFEVVRFEPKGFVQRRPDGKGAHVWNLEGVRRILYRLPDIINSGPVSFIFVVEGEKDADRLTREDVIATTCPGGAGKWHLVDNSPLQGRHVVILPDNDNTGHQHAQQVATALSGKAASVRILVLPGLSEKGDVSDWLDAGGDVEDLVRLAEAEPLWTSSPESISPIAIEVGRSNSAQAHFGQHGRRDASAGTVAVAGTDRLGQADPHRRRSWAGKVVLDLGHRLACIDRFGGGRKPRLSASNPEGWFCFQPRTTVPIRSARGWMQLGRMRHGSERLRVW